MKNTKLIVISLFIALFFQQAAHSRDPERLVPGSDDKYINSICFSKNGGIIANSEGRNILIRNTYNDSILLRLSGGHSDKILALDISRDSSMIVSGGRDSLIILWDLINKRIIKKLGYHSGKVTAVRFDPSGSYLYSGSTDKRVVCYDIVNDKLVFDKSFHTEAILSIDTSNDGKMLVSGGADKNVIILDALTGDQLTSPGSFKNWIRCVRFSPDCSTLAVCCDNGYVYIWSRGDYKGFKFNYKQKFSESWITGIDFANDNDSFLYSLENGKAGLSIRGTRYIYKAHFPVRMIRYQPGDGAYISFAIATWGGGVKLVKGESMILVR